MSAICTQIALENVNCSHYALRVMSRMVESLKNEDEKWDIRNKVYNKLCNQPNSAYSQLWLQNITYQRDKKNGTSPYSMRLCRLAVGDSDVKPWNCTWIREKLRSKLPIDSVIDQDVLKKSTPIIMFREARAYYDGVAEQ